MKIPPVKGTRDFYPPLMAVRNYLTDGWKAVSRRNGFEEYDGPIFEYLQMYTLKSGDEIAEQLFSLQDRGGRDLAIRPEITPTLARMVSQQINALPRPIKWFSVPRLCRAERPQKGRLREFFQWNIDVIGVEDVLADAEIIFCALDYLQEAGLTAQDVVVRISSRRMLAEVLLALGVAQDQLQALYAVLDKKNKVPPEAFEQMLAGQIADDSLRGKVQVLMAAKGLDEVGPMVSSEGARQALAELRGLFETVTTMGIGDFCVFDIGIVRGLAYYTGVVFEIFDRASQLRAIGGGGRYDNLLAQFGGPQVTATGQGMGDCVLGILLEEKGLLKDRVPQPRLDWFVAPADPQYVGKAIEIAARLRRMGVSAGFSYKPTGLGKQLRQASDQHAQRCLIVGDEIRQGRLVVKDMAGGTQELVEVDRFFAGTAPKDPSTGSCV